ncbi:MAG TPA: DNA alkylation repair protein [Coriobacteriia bacterium]
MRTSADIVAELRSLSDPANVAGMARFGISPKGLLGVSVPVLRGIARDLGPERRRDPEAAHTLARDLWASGVHEARLLAAFVDVPRLVTSEQADEWVAEIDSWDVCDQLCGSLFDEVPFAREKALAWADREEMFVKRAGFVMMAVLALRDKHGPDEPFLQFLTLVEREADDDRNFVKKAVNWALRQIGKRNGDLNAAAVATAQRLRDSDSRAARWVASDALRELTSEQVRGRLGL